MSEASITQRRPSEAYIQQLPLSDHVRRNFCKLLPPEELEVFYWRERQDIWQRKHGTLVSDAEALHIRDEWLAYVETRDYLRKLVSQGAVRQPDRVISADINVYAAVTHHWAWRKHRLLPPADPQNRVYRLKNVVGPHAMDDRMPHNPLRLRERLRGVDGTPAEREEWALYFDLPESARAAKTMPMPFELAFRALALFAPAWAAILQEKHGQRLGQAEIAQRRGITQARVSQLMKQSLTDLSTLTGIPSVRLAHDLGHNRLKIPVANDL